MKKKHLLLIIIVLIIAIISICAYLKKPNEEPVVNEKPKSKLIEKVTDRNNYYMVENCVNKFYTYYVNVFENKNPDENDIQKMYNLLDKQYINYKNITQENLASIIPAINRSVVNVYDIYVSYQSENQSLYIISGILREERTNTLSNFKIMVRTDKHNETFAVLLQDYVEEKYNNLNVGENLEIATTDNIEKNKNNIYVLEEITDKTYILDLFERYKEEALYNTELAYKNLDAEYKNAKFKNLDGFTEYVKNNENRLISMELEKYTVSEEEAFKQYIGIDKQGYYYIFKETELMKYSIILDTYTIDLPEFLEKYNSATTVDKVGYNIQKVLDAINSKDYEYVYNKLDFEFKAVNYPIIENFEKEIKAKLFDRNKVKAVSSFNEGSTYAFKLTITDENNNEKEQKMTVIMQLKEGTDFVMSFSFE